MPGINQVCVLQKQKTTYEYTPSQCQNEKQTRALTFVDRKRVLLFYLALHGFTPVWVGRAVSQWSTLSLRRHTPLFESPDRGGVYENQVKLKLKTNLVLDSYRNPNPLIGFLNRTFWGGGV